MERQDLLPLLAFLAGSLLAAAPGVIFRPGAWYERLAKPAWRPPNRLFGPVWTILYIMMAVAGWLVWTTLESPGQRALPIGLFALQLGLNALWSAIFFGLRRIAPALAEMALLWLAILATILAFHPIHAGAAWLLLPYLAWVSFAFALNLAVWRLNRAGGQGPAPGSARSPIK